MKTWTVGRRIIAGFGAITSMSVASGIFARMQLVTIKVHSTLVSISAKVEQGLPQIVERAIGELNSAVARIEKITHSNASSAEQGLANSEELTTEADALADAVSQLLQLAGARSNSDTVSPDVDDAIVAQTFPERPVEDQQHAEQEQRHAA